MRLHWVEGDPSSLEALRSADLGAADSIVIGDSGEGPAKEADALTLTTIALAQVPLTPQFLFSQIPQCMKVKAWSFLVHESGPAKLV